MTEHKLNELTGEIIGIAIEVHRNVTYLKQGIKRIKNGYLPL